MLEVQLLMEHAELITAIQYVAISQKAVAVQLMDSGMSSSLLSKKLSFLFCQICWRSCFELLF